MLAVQLRDLGNLLYWEVSSGELIGSSKYRSHFDSIAIAPDASIIVAGINAEDSGATAIRVGAQPLLAAVPAAVQTTLLDVDVSDDGYVAAAGGSRVFLWDIRRRSLFHTIGTYNETITDIAFTGENHDLLMCFNDGFQRRNGNGAVVQNLRPSPGKKLNAVAADSGQRFMVLGCDDAAAYVYPYGLSTLHRKLAGHTGNVIAVAITADGATIATASMDNTIKLWESETGSLLHTLQGHTKNPRQVAFSPDGANLVSTGADNTVKLWRTADGAFLADLLTGVDVRGVSYSHDGSEIAVVHPNNGIYIFHDGLYELHKADDPQAQAYIPGDYQMVTASGSGIVQVWGTPAPFEITCTPGPINAGLSSAFLSAAGLYEVATNPAEVPFNIAFTGDAGTFEDAYPLDCHDAASGPMEVSLELSDGYHSQSCELQVQVVDDVAPIARIQDATLELDSTGNATLSPAQIDGGSEDNCDGATLGVSPAAFDCASLGSNGVQLTIIDAAGNNASASATVDVVDVLLPVLTLIGGDIQLECGAVYSEPGYSAVDNCSGEVTGSVVISGEVNASLPGTYILEYSAVDASGNTANATRSVVVVDTLAPILTWNGPTTISCDSAIPITAADNCAGDFTSQVQIISGSINLTRAGAYTVTFGATDFSGNTGSTTVTVQVVDDVPPIITLAGREELAVCGEDFADPGATAIDACGGEVAVSSSAAETVDAGTPGVYVIEYAAVDPSGNTATLTRLVRITSECSLVPHAADSNGDGALNLTELMRVIQMRNAGGYSCPQGAAEDGYSVGPGPHDCAPHSADYAPQDWKFSLEEVLRVVQFFNSGGYDSCGGSEDGFCVAGAGA